MINRERLIAAAARIYSEAGFRGATTRRIAEEAGVNEVTLFRQFGSKARLIAEAVHCSHQMAEATLPEKPGDAQRELSDWCGQHLSAMRESRDIIRKSLAELAEHPEMEQFLCAGPSQHFARLVAYAKQLAPPGNVLERQHVTTACAMLFGVIFADGMGRDVVKTIYPRPERDAAAQYVRVFLRALDCSAPKRPLPRRAVSPRARGAAT